MGFLTLEKRMKTEIILIRPEAEIKYLEKNPNFIIIQSPIETNFGVPKTRVLWKKEWLGVLIEPIFPIYNWKIFR